MKSLFVTMALFFTVCTTFGDAASCTLRERYQMGCEAYEADNWAEAAREYNLVCTNFPDSTFAHEALFYYGISAYHLKDYDLSNDCFSEYLRCQSNPRYFEEAIEYKYYIAECFRGGAKTHVLGYKSLPKWASGHESAIEIYDEVIAALPSSDLAAKSLYSKGCLLWSMKEYKESIDAYQAVIRRFPKNELAPECYSLINQVY